MSKCTADDVLESIDSWTVLDVHKLVKGLEEKYGISAAPVAVAAAAPAAGGAASGGEEKTSYTVMLMGAGSNKIAAIKVVREITGLGLAESKALVEAAPKAVKEGVTKEQAEELKKKIADSGASVEIK